MEPSKDPTFSDRLRELAERFDQKKAVGEELGACQIFQTGDEFTILEVTKLPEAAEQAP